MPRRPIGSRWGAIISRLAHIPSRRPWFPYVLAIMAALMATVARWLLGQVLGAQLSAYITFYPVVLLAALFGGIGPGLVTTCLAAVSVSYFFLRPTGSFAVAHPADEVGLALFVAINIAVTFVCGALRSARHRSFAEAQRAVASEERLRLFMEHMPTLAWVKDDQGRYTYINKAYEQRFGHTLVRCQGKTDAELWTAEVAQRLQQADQAALVAGHPIEVIEQTTDPSGSVSVWLNTKFPVRDASGRQFIASIGLDITERQQAQHALEAAKTRIETILASITDCFFAIDHDLRFTYVNPEAQRVLRKAPAELLGGRLADLFPHAEAFLAQYLRVLATQEPVHFEEFYVPFQIWCEVHAYPSPEGLSVYFRDVTQRRRAEDALRASERNFRALAESVPQFVWATNPDGQVDYVNDRWCAYTGQTPEQAHGTGWAAALHPDDRPSALARWSTAASTGHLYEFEYRLRRHDGQYRWFLARGVPLRDPQGRIERWFGTSTDIADRKRFQEVVQDSETRLRLAVETAELGMYERDLITNKVTLNPACQAIFGVKEHFAPDVARRSVHPEDLDRVLSEAAGAFNPELRAVCGAEFRIIRPDGTIRWVAGRGRVLFDDEAKPAQPAKFIGVLNDITERKQSELRLTRDLKAMTSLQQVAALFAQEGNLQPVLQEIVDAAISIADADFGNMQLFTPDFGLRIAAQHGFPQWYLDFWNQVTEGHGSCGTALARAERVIIPDVEKSPIFADKAALEFQRRAGVRAVQSTPLLARSGKPLGMLSTHFKHPHTPDDQTLRLLDLLARQAADIVERAQAEEALRHAKDDLAQTNARLDRLVHERTAKLEDTVAELEHFSYTITHDMRAPLRAMIGYAGILKSLHAQSFSDQGRDLLRRISESALRMDQLITDALQYSRVVRDEFPLQPVDPSGALRGIIESYPQFQPPRAHITVQPDMPSVLANPAALTQVFSNFLGNAIKFVSPGKIPQITVSAEIQPLAEASPAGNSARWVRLCVADNGIGIHPEYHDKVWQMFQRLSKNYEGTGIGLALVRKVVERMGGKVGLESTPDQGSRFWVELQKAS